VFSLLLLLTFTAVSLPAQQKPSVAGDYTGMLGPLHLKLHLKVDATGTITGTLDSTDQGALGIRCADFHLDTQAFSFSVPDVHGTWKGTVTAVGLEGAWDQGVPQPLSFLRDTFVPAEKPSRVDGIWLGTLQGGGLNLRVQIHVKSGSNGQEFCTFDSLDQGAMGLQCSKVLFSAPDFSFEVPIVQGSWAGKLSADGTSLSGIWSQGPRPLNFIRQSAELSPAPVPAATYVPAMAPVLATDLQAVMDRDLA